MKKNPTEEEKKKRNDYVIAYMKNNCISYKFRLNKKTDAKAIEVMDSIPNKRQWLISKLLEEKERTK